MSEAYIINIPEFHRARKFGNQYAVIKNSYTRGLFRSYKQAEKLVKRLNKA